MTIRKAKKRNDYLFYAESTEYFRDELIAGEYDFWDEYHSAKEGTFNRGAAYLELGWCDIELNINCAVDESGRYINKVVPAYFICVKGKPETGGEEWRPVGYIDDIGNTVKVDWAADDWKEQLEKDMLENLMIAAKRLDLKIDEPNWEDESHAFDAFDRLMDLVNQVFCE